MLGKEEFVVVQLLYDKKIKLAVSTSWILEFELIRKKLTSALKHTEPVFLFYHPDSSVKPVFSNSIYKNTFEPTAAAMYKGYVVNKLYGKRHSNAFSDIAANISSLLLLDSLAYAQLDLETKRLSTAPKGLTAEKSELELERKLKVVKRARKTKLDKIDKENVERAKIANATYVNKAILRKTIAESATPSEAKVQDSTSTETLNSIDIDQMVPKNSEQLTVSSKADILSENSDHFESLANGSTIRESTIASDKVFETSNSEVVTSSPAEAMRVEQAASFV